MEELPTDPGTDPAVSATESALVVLEALLDAEDNEELKVEELELDKLELGEDEDGVGLGLEVVEGGGGVVVDDGGGGGCEVVVGAGGSGKADVGRGGRTGALPKDHVPEITPLLSGAKNWKRPSEKSRPP
jgi:hypothetical protein